MQCRRKASRSATIKKQRWSPIRRLGDDHDAVESKLSRESVSRDVATLVSLSMCRNRLATRSRLQAQGQIFQNQSRLASRSEKVSSGKTWGPNYRDTSRSQGGSTR